MLKQFSTIAMLEISTLITPRQKVRSIRPLNFKKVNFFQSSSILQNLMIAYKLIKSG